MLRVNVNLIQQIKPHVFSKTFYMGVFLHEFFKLIFGKVDLLVAFGLLNGSGDLQIAIPYLFVNFTKDLRFFLFNNVFLDGVVYLDLDDSTIRYFWLIPCHGQVKAQAFVFIMLSQGVPCFKKCLFRKCVRTICCL